MNTYYYGDDPIYEKKNWRQLFVHINEDSEPLAAQYAPTDNPV